MVNKKMLEFQVYMAEEDKCMCSFDIMEVLCIHQVLENHSVLDDRCVVEFKNGKSLTVAVGYDKLKEYLNNVVSNSNEVAKFPFRNMKNTVNGFGMDDFKELVKEAKANNTDDFKEVAKLWANMKKRKN